MRAIAVLLVVLDHAGVAMVSGGFVGVDVFFVISGFLITALISRRRERGEFSFGEFYWRRAKRLLPALYVTMLVTLAVGWRLLIPSDYSLLAQSALWAVGLASNVFFWSHTGGYFSPDAATLPLLHIWSLSVEEQFYLLWPAALLLLLRLPSKAGRIGLVAVVALASFAFAHVWQDVIGAYFLLPSRAGEFLTGALVYLLWKPRQANAVAANLLSGVGLALILAAGFVFHDQTWFPGFLALLPCGGAALIIGAPQFGPSLVTRLLSTRPFAFVGLISYSVYLWHWPIVSYLKGARVELTPMVVVAIVIASLALGWLSWAVLERGFRSRLDRRSRPALALGAVLSLAVVAAPLLILVRQGVPERFPFALLTQAELTAERDRYWRDLPATSEALSAGAQAKMLLIVGNSHAYDLAYALNENGYPGKIKLIESSSYCFNFGHDPKIAAFAPVCAERLQAVLTSPDLKLADVVYLHDDWGGYDEAGLADMIGKIRAVTPAPIYVFGPKMAFPLSVLEISRQAQGQHYATPAQINGFAKRYEEPEKAERDRRLKAFFRMRNLPATHYVSTLDAQCGAQLVCEILSPAGQYLYFDESHLTLVGAKQLGRHLRKAHPDVF